MDIIGTKLAPGEHESNFMKVGAIPSEPSTRPCSTGILLLSK